MNALAIRKGLWLALALFGLGLCLFADCTPLKNSPILGPALAEVAAVLADPGSQWMVFVCEGIYFVGFVVLRRRLASQRRPGTRWNASLPGELWLLGMLAVAAVAYALDYPGAAQSTQALTLLGGAMIGQGAAFWESRKQKAESRNGGGGTVLALIILLAGAAVWQVEAGHLFQYRGQARWAGPWDNPNTFGVLMGAGAVLAIGLLASGKAESRKQKAEMGGEHPASNIQHPTSNWGRWVLGKAESRKQKAEIGTGQAEMLKAARRWAVVAAAGAMGVGLVRSYSRGAWVGTAVALMYLLLKAERRKQKAEIGRGKGESGKQRAETSRGNAEKPKTEKLTVARRWGTVAVICAAVGVVGFWTFQQSAGSVARRAYSVANANDFSWRNRVTAWEGALQMMAEKPWFGYGWNQPERVYGAYYCPAKVDEAAAIQLNDYFMLGMTLGVPALACFVMYAGLCLAGRPFWEVCRLGETTDYRPLTTDNWLSVACRAGAIVLLAGFWFDGGLFKLATAATFWILLELGRRGNHERHKTHEND
jgi:O-antigen ligase